MILLEIGKSSLVNTNKLVRNYPGCTGLKTGSTSQALYNLSASASRNNLDLVAVVMKAPTSKIRFKNASALLDYGFTNYEYKKLLNSGDIIKNIEINKGISSFINATAKNDCASILAKGQDMDIKQTISAPDKLDAPIFQGQIVGNVKYTLNDEIIANVNLISDISVEKINCFSMNKLVINNWLSLLRK